MANTWIITSNTQISALVETGRRIGGTVTVVALGEGAGFAGVDRVIALPVPDAAPLEALAPAVVTAVAAAPGDVILAPNRPAERVLAGAVAAKLDAPVLTNVKDVADNGITVARFGGITRETVRVASAAVVIMDGGQAVEGSPVAAVPAAVEVGPATVVAQQTAEVKVVNIGAAKRVVGVGRGFKAEGDLQLARDLAAALGAEVACSRPLAEGVNWLPKEIYLGISGQTIKPALYLAAGISGQLQHMTGVQDAATIVAINKDGDAPIFAYADYGIVGDLYEVLPALAKALA